MHEYLDLDKLTLNEIAKQAGKPINETAYLAALNQAKREHCLFDVRKLGKLQGYVSLKNAGNGKWFVLMFVIHPQHRSRATFTALFSKLQTHLKRVKARELVSHVYKVNWPSVAFHKKLGFKISKESTQAYEFTLVISSLTTNKHLVRLMKNMT